MEVRKFKSGQNKKSRVFIRTSQKASIRQLILKATPILAGAMVCMIVYFQIGKSEIAKAFTLGDYRSVKSGNWKEASTWESFDGTSWVKAATPPNVSVNAIEISEGNQVVISSKVKADQLTVKKNATLISENGSLIIENGPGIDLMVEGEIIVNGNIEIKNGAHFSVENCTLNTSGEIDLAGEMFVHGDFKNMGGNLLIEKDHITVEKNGIYEHAFDGGLLPLAEWDKNSLCKITGIEGNVPKNIGQAFGNLEWDSPKQMTDVDLKGELSIVKGDILIKSTGKGQIFIDKFGTKELVELPKDLTISGGSIYVNETGSSQLLIKGNLRINSGQLSMNTPTSLHNSTLTINGNTTISGGEIDLNSSSSAEIGKLFLKGNLVVNAAGKIVESSRNKGGSIDFCGRSIQFIVCNNNIKNKIDFRVSEGSTLRTDNYILTGSGNFTVSDNSGLMIGSADGITKSGNKGNIQVRGKREFSTKADYIYNGGIEQSTGDGLPTLVSGLKISNEDNCILTNSVSVSHRLQLETGKLLSENSILTLGTNENEIGKLEIGNGYIVGNFKRWVSSKSIGEIIFPVGTTSTQNNAIVKYTKSPENGGTISCLLGFGNLNTQGLPLTDAGDVCLNLGASYWSFIPSSGLKGGAFDLALSTAGFQGIQNYEKLHISRRANMDKPWINSGSHITSEGSNDEAIVHRANLTEMGIFGITSSSANALPSDQVFIKASKKNQSVFLYWGGNNISSIDHYVVERSSNGSEYNVIGEIKNDNVGPDKESFSFNDYQPLDGSNYYRIKKIGNTGKIINSNVEQIVIQPRHLTANTVNIEKAEINYLNSTITTEFYSDKNGDVAIELIGAAGKSIYKDYQYAVRGFNKVTFAKSAKTPAGELLVRISNSTGASTRLVTKNQ